MKPTDIHPELRVKIVKLRPRAKIADNLMYLSNRRVDVVGTVRCHIVGTQIKAWWIDHGDGTIAPYHYTELEPA